MQPGFFIVVLPLEPQGVVDVVHVQPQHVAVGAVARRPADAAIDGGQLLGSAKVVEVVEIRSILDYLAHSLLNTNSSIIILLVERHQLITRSHYH